MRAPLVRSGSKLGLVTLLVAASVVANGCRSDAREAPGPRSAATSVAIAALEAMPTFAAHLHPAARVVGPNAARLETTAPRPESIHIANTLRDSAWLELRRLGIDPTRVVQRGLATVRSAARADTDLVDIIEPARFEEVRVAYSERAPHEATWELAAGPAVASITLSDDRVRVLAANGETLLVSEPAFAEDATGRRFPVRLSLSDNFLKTGRGTWTLSATWALDGAVYPVAIDPAWVAGPTSTARGGATVTLLPSGKVLVAGGYNVGGGSLSSAEIFDPTTRTWSAASPLPSARSSHTAVLLSTGRVLVAGGTVGTTSLQTAVLYDPASNSWSSAATMNQPRSQHLAALLGSGKVLVAGGGSTGGEVYDPSADTWTATSAMSTDHRGGGMARVGAKVLAVGGGSPSTSTAELYDPTTNSWAPTGSLSSPRLGLGAATLTGGKVLVVGGFDVATVFSTAELFNPATGTFSSAASMVGRHSNAATFPLSGNKAFVYSADTVPSTEIYDGVANTWTTATSPPTGLQNPVAVALSLNQVLLVSGYGPDLTTAPQIYTLQALGGTCALAGDCDSLICADGVCCNSVCTGTCQACDIAGKLGTCSPVSGDPHGFKSCGSPFACEAGACRSTCTIDAHCYSANYCVGSTCVTKKAAGASCSAARECGSGFCVDGVCCNSACTNQCQACNNTGSVGTCSTVVGAPKAPRAACTGAGAGTACGPACNGSDSTMCQPLGPSAPCSANACTAGIETHASTCDGSGVCKDTPKNCGVYACGGATCRTSCTVKDDCKAGYFCSAGACVPAKGLGTPCTDASSCGSGLFCTDGACCGVVACDAGSSCGGAKDPGTCTKSAGVSCTTNGECGTGICADGVCCNKACSGQCEACDVPGKAGTCSPVGGAPRGARPKCDDGGGDACKALACDGAVDTTKCTGFAAGGSVTCKDPSCASSSYVGASKCDGKGSCVAPVTTSCIPYGCDATGCRTSCTTNTDCTDGFECRSGRCITKGTARCTPDGTASIPSGGDPVSCAPYLCGDDGRCRTVCSNTTECASGTVCDIASTTCVPGAIDTADSGGGCSVGSASSTRSTTPGLLLLAAIVLARLRARRRAVTLLAAAGAVSCGSFETKSNNGPDAAVAAIASPANDLALIGRVPLTAPRVRAASSLELAGAGYRVTSASDLDASIPGRATAPLRLATPGAWLEVRAIGAEPRPVTLEGKLAIARGALGRGIDLAYVAGAGFVEELRIVRDASVRDARWELRHGGAIVGVRVRDARIEAVDASGRVVLGTPPIAIADDRGHERRANVSVEHVGDVDVVTATFDPSVFTLPLIIDPVWTTTGAPTKSPQDATVTLLASGKALRASGQGTSTAELYDPTTNAWTDAAPLSVARYWHTAVRLPSGKVLVAGGSGLSSAEVYDPATNAWSATGPMSATRSFSSSVLLASGKVLVASDSSSEIYDPATGTWGAAVSMNAGHCSGAMTLLPSGKALLAGGKCIAIAGSTTASELYDPVAGTWALTGSLKESRASYSIELLSTGKVLAAGGEDYNAVDGYVYRSTAELYDPAAGTWSLTAKTSVTRGYAALATVTNGRVLVVSDLSSTAELYDGTSNTWSPVSALSSIVARPIATRLADGSVLVTGNTQPRRFTLLKSATACTLAGDCESSFCVDGVCCSAACAGACQACDVAAAIGVCTNVTGTPHGARSCGAYSCSAGACTTGCSGATGCAPTAYCVGTTCVAKKALGTTCAASTECSSGSCADGVCCNTSCTAQCAACDMPGKVGTCSAAIGVPHGTRAACSGVGAGSIPCGIGCDGTDTSVCRYPGATIACGADACKDGFETHLTTCNGAGACSDTPKSCGAFACGSTVCNTKCTLKEDCAAGFFCAAGGVCTPVSGLGSPCKDASVCKGGLFCTDGACCGVASCGAMKSCNTPARAGTCAKNLAGACTADVECGSGHCADGVCCDGACSGQCEACDLAGKVGNCAPVSGAPHGGRSKCDDGGSDVCRARACDGAKDTMTCAGFVAGPTVECAPAKCAGSSLVPAARCDGAGTCAAPGSVSCTPYVCSASSCLASCVQPDDCAADFECKGSVCVAKPKDKCEPDGLSSRGPDTTVTSCAPYRCGTDGRCQSACGTSADCAPGTACDTSTKTCASGDAADSGGCAMASTRSSSTFALSALACLAVLLRARSRSGRAFRSRR